MDLQRSVSPTVVSRRSTAPPPSEVLALGIELRSHDRTQEEHLQSHTNRNRTVGLDSVGNGNPHSRSPSKKRSMSDGIKPALSPSPAFREPARTSRDDIAILPSPVTPQRPKSLARGLSLQMPHDSNSATFLNRVPLSPKLDSSTYGSPTSVLPRRSRGLDFSRACTNLHHSTLAEQSSPDSSPTIGGKGMTIPPRKGLSHSSSLLESPVSTSNSLWSTMANTDKAAVSSSIGSLNMLDTDSGSTSSDEDDLMDQGDGEDTIITTPQVYKLGNSMTNPFAPSNLSSPGTEWMGYHSPATASLMSFQRRTRLRNGRSKKISGSISAHSSVQSSGPSSPPLLKSIESSIGGGYLNKEGTKTTIGSRRESLSLGTKELHLSDGGDSCEDGDSKVSPHQNPVTPATPGMDEKRGVIRRAVTRRGNLLPKTKNFARIRAALMEEGAPIDTEVRREAEVIRQVRESDNDLEAGHQSLQLPTDSSPNLLPAVPGLSESLEDVPEQSNRGRDTLAASSDRPFSNNFTRQAIRNSGGIEFWNTFDDRVRTPPPPLFPGGSSSGISEDMNMDTPQSSAVSIGSRAELQKSQYSSRSRSQTPQPPSMPSPAEISWKVGKRRRDDDLDAYSFKRRAVSPGLSLQNSPVLPQSPAHKDSGWWGLPPKTNREVPSGSVASERANSNGSVSSSSGHGPPKRVGFQGMSDTNDGLMNMSIE